MKRALSFAFVLAAATTGCIDPCEPDEHEGTDDSVPSDLGSFSDSGTRETFNNLTFSSADDEDFFVFRTVDGGIDGNPEVFITADSNESLEITTMLTCAGEAPPWTCDEPGSESACRVAFGEEAFLDLTYDCEGGFFDDTDNAVVVLRVRRTEPAETCATYDLEIFVD
ncbi:MAG: hypothetical protein HOW73_44195 [Polyangiaceae bacterium]|nr:hypothetical protein [Polyangiaceae bacterium]